ncbi:MAG: hypothetical protein V1492_01865 [Candidatus Micrarchaeota archaeon]
MIGIVGIRLNEGEIKIKEDSPPKEITIDLKLDKISKTEDPAVADVKFIYSIIYAPNSALVQLGGEVLVSDAPDAIDKLVKSWKEKHRIEEEPATIIMNTINSYVSLNALFILRVFNLPPHISPPAILPPQKMPPQKKQK